MRCLSRSILSSVLHAVRNRVASALGSTTVPYRFTRLCLCACVCVCVNICRHIHHVTMSTSHVNVWKYIHHVNLPNAQAITSHTHKHIHAPEAEMIPGLDLELRASNRSTAGGSLGCDRLLQQPVEFKQWHALLYLELVFAHCCSCTHAVS